jgi:hypothetical protein
MATNKDHTHASLSSAALRFFALDIAAADILRRCFDTSEDRVAGIPHEGVASLSFLTSLPSELETKAGGICLAR